MLSPWWMLASYTAGVISAFGLLFLIAMASYTVERRRRSRTEVPTDEKREYAPGDVVPIRPSMEALTRDRFYRGPNSERPQRNT